MTFQVGRVLLSKVLQNFFSVSFVSPIGFNLVVGFIDFQEEYAILKFGQKSHLQEEILRGGKDFKTKHYRKKVLNKISPPITG